jgi:CRISPR-associated protein Csx10
MTAMTELAYQIELLSDVVVTADSATEGGHEGLDYLPGSLFLGVAASAIKPFDPDLFLSGKVRFLNAYPLWNGRETHPVPLSYHTPKGDKSALPTNRLIESAESMQMEQCRKGFAPSEGAPIVKIRLGNQLKTAIHRDNRRSEDGQLFDYSSISAGTVFMLKVQIDRSGDDQRIKDAFDGKTLHVGRSRSAEYGLVRCSPLNKTEHKTEQRNPCLFDGADNRMALYLASDLALVRNGLPVLQPHAADFGLGQAEFRPDQSYLQVRRYVPWNAFYNCYTTERQVLCKGSVLVFDNVSANPKEVQQQLSAGVGLYVEEGLGQVWVNPEWLVRAHKTAAMTGSSPNVPPKPNTPLVQFLSNKAARLDNSRSAFETAMDWAKAWMELYPAKSGGDRDKNLPTKTQWSGIRNIAVKNLRAPGQLRNEIIGFCTLSLRRKMWGDETAPKTMLHKLLAKIGDNPNESTCLTLQHAAAEMRRRIDAIEHSKKDEK